jgi:hypothetical protein
MPTQRLTAEIITAAIEGFEYRGFVPVPSLRLFDPPAVIVLHKVEGFVTKGA